MGEVGLHGARRDEQPGADVLVAQPFCDQTAQHRFPSGSVIPSRWWVVCARRDRVARTRSPPRSIVQHLRPTQRQNRSAPTPPEPSPRRRRSRLDTSGSGRVPCAARMASAAPNRRAAYGWLPPSAARRARHSRVSATRRYPWVRAARRGRHGRRARPARVHPAPTAMKARTVSADIWCQPGTTATVSSAQRRAVTRSPHANAASAVGTVLLVNASRTADGVLQGLLGCPPRRRSVAVGESDDGERPRTPCLPEIPPMLSAAAQGRLRRVVCGCRLTLERKPCAVGIQDHRPSSWGPRPPPPRRPGHG